MFERADQLKQLLDKRLLMNLELMKAGYPPVIIPMDQRLRYYQALDTAHVDANYQPFIALATEMVEQSFSPYFFALGIQTS